MSQESMRGKAPKAGKGVGRKAGEGSTRVRVPNGCLHAVMELIDAYRAGTIEPLMPVPEIKGQGVLNLVPEIKQDEPLKPVPEIKEPAGSVVTTGNGSPSTNRLKAVPEIKEPDWSSVTLRRRSLEKLPGEYRRYIQSLGYRSMELAAIDGHYAIPATLPDLGWDFARWES